MIISVIIPTYKPGDYIWDCFESLQHQICSLDNFEVIVVLNGDKEPYYEKIENYLRNSKLHYKLISTYEKGVSNARNIGLDNAKGEYITFLDDDDKISPHFLLELYNVSNNGAISLSNLIAFDERNQQILPDYISDVFKYNCNKEIKNIMQVRSYFSSPCAKLISRDIIGNRRFNKKYSIGEDGLFMLLISDRFKKFAFTSPNAVYYRRVRIESASSNNIPKLKKIKNSLCIAKEYTLIWLENIKGYNFFFIISRYMAEVKYILKCIFSK